MNIILSIWWRQPEVKISAATPHGIFNGTQTLLSMLKDKQTPCCWGSLIRDYPDLAYRGQMIDIAVISPLGERRNWWIFLHLFSN